MSVPPIQDSERDLVVTALRANALNASGVTLWLGQLGASPRVQLVLDDLVSSGRVVRERQSIAGEEFGGIYRLIEPEAAEAEPALAGASGGPVATR